MDIHKSHPFPSKLIPPRNVDILLPPGYAQDSEQRYPVLYMHDGQNLFEPDLSFKEVDWGVAPAVKRLMAAENFTPPIVVGIWNTANRLGEYMPEKPMGDPAVLARVIRFIRRIPGGVQFDLCGDAYLAFIVDELKPWVDAEFRTLENSRNTHIAGSSMGGLISTVRGVPVSAGILRSGVRLQCVELWPRCVDPVLQPAPAGPCQSPAVF